MNALLLHAAFAQGHRNRVGYLTERLNEGATKAFNEGRRFRVLSIGCGPAEETFRFLKGHAHPEVVDFDLLDFSRETLDWTAARLEATMQETGRRANVRTIEDSVYNLAKRKPSEEVAEYDMVVCAGLFDYLTDRFCQRVVNYCLAKTIPGGLAVVTNVCLGPDYYFTEQVMDWPLILRNKAETTALLPSSPDFALNVYIDETTTNVIAEVRKLR